MKPLPLLVASALVLALVFSPLAFGAGSISFSSPAAGASYKGTQSYSITGQITPIPSQADSVFISVKNPSGVTVDAADVAVAPTTGTFTYSTATGGSGNWISGTYTISATDSFSTSGSTTFSYTAPGALPSGSGLAVSVQATTPVFSGQSVEVTATVSWGNGSLASVSGFPVAQYVQPGSTSEVQLGTPTEISTGAYMWTVALANNAAGGLYLVLIQANASGIHAFGTGSWTVNNELANGPQLQKDNAGNFSALSSAIAAINTAVGNVNSAVGGITSTLSSMQTTLGNINTNVSNLSGLSTQLTNATNSIGTTQTYVLVVAVLAAITLVLELAILVRKLS